jgi:aconitate hydratase
MKQKVISLEKTPVEDGGYGLDERRVEQTVEIKYKDGKTEQLKTGAVVISSSITSCTNTSNPAVDYWCGSSGKESCGTWFDQAQICEEQFGSRFP